MNPLRQVARRAYSTIHPGSRPGVCVAHENLEKTLFFDTFSLFFYLDY